MSKFNFFNKKVEYIMSPEEREKIENLLKESTVSLMPRPNDDFECVVPLFNSRKHYKHLKKMMWKFRK